MCIVLFSCENGSIVFECETVKFYLIAMISYKQMVPGEQAGEYTNRYSS